jgi:Rieske 2Fe-2S family protein
MSEPTEGYLGLTEKHATLPAKYYIDEQHYQRELSAIWYRQWVYVCRADELTGPRAFRSIDIGSQNILIVRDEENQLQAFHNTCRHRGSVLCTEKQGRLVSKSIICPYHKWTYSLQGKLKRTPSKNHPAGFNKEDYPLYGVAVEEWKGFIFVNLAGEKTEPFVTSLHCDSANLDNWPMESLKIGHVYRKTMECNWKIFWENFNECLHCAGVHPELCKLVPIYSRGYMEKEDDPNWQDHAGSSDPRLTGGMSEGALTWTSDGQPAGKQFENLTEEQQKTGYHYVVSRPSAFIAAHVDYVRIVRLLPLGAEKTELQVQWLFTEETLADESVDIEKVAEFAQLVMAQDAEVSELNQRGLRSIRHEQGVLMAEENDVYNFQQWVREQLRDFGGSSPRT